MGQEVGVLLNLKKIKDRETIRKFPFLTPDTEYNVGAMAVVPERVKERPPQLSI